MKSSILSPLPSSGSPSRAGSFPRRSLRRALLLPAILLGVSLQAQINYATPYFFTTLAGINAAGASDGTGPSARFFQPAGVAVDAGGNVYVSDTGNHTIRKITFYGVVTTIAGTAGTPGSINGTGTAARFSSPRGLAVDSSGNVYVADTGNHLIRKITPAGVVTTLAGSVAGSADGIGTAARFFSANAVAVDAAGNVFVADTSNHSIRRITPDGVVTTIAGPLNPGSFGSTDGTGPTARFNSPRGVALDASGNIYVADRDNYEIRKVTPAGVVTTLAGASLGISGNTDGTGSAARFNQVYGVAVDGSGNVYVVDASNASIRKVTPAGVVTTLAGGAGTGTTDGTGATVRFNFPQAIAIDRRGNLYVTDTINHTLRMSVFTPDIAPQPAGQVVSPGASVTLVSGASSNVPITYQWQKDGAALAGATGTSLAVTNIQSANLGSYALVATNMAGASTSNPAILSFTPPPAIALQPASQTVAPGSSVTFTASATSTLPITYQWQKDGVAIPGATASTLTVTSVQASNLGSYTLVATNASGSTTSNAATLAFPLSNTGRLINLSILTTLGTGGDSFTMGYVVGGTGTTGAKPLVIRVAGPSLTQLGVAGALDDPKLETFAGQTKTGENDNWGGALALADAMAAVGAFPYAGPTSRDAAAAVSITSSDNSVRVTAVGNGSGAVIAELYDATPTASFSNSTPRLINVSVLKNLGTGLTAGFVVGGATPKTVLIRAVGPTLGAAPFNVAGVVADPQLALFSGQTRIGQNDDWGGTAPLAAAFSQVGAFALPVASKDAALLATLAPGDYTVQVSGTGTTTGVALVEVYEVP